MHPPAGKVCRVFNLDQSGGGAEPAVGADRRLDVLPGQNPAFGRHGADQAAGKNGRRRHLVVQNVRPRLCDHFLSGLRQQANRNLVAHGAGGHKQRSLAAEDLSRAPLQQIDGGVLAVNVVAHLSRRHRRAHLERRLRHGIGTKINDCWQWSIISLSASR